VSRSILAALGVCAFAVGCKSLGIDDPASVGGVYDSATQMAGGALSGINPILGAAFVAAAAAGKGAVLKLIGATPTYSGPQDTVPPA